ncbi:MAG: tetratricopeptide repeat protein [Legionella sp.]
MKLIINTIILIIEMVALTACVTSQFNVRQGIKSFQVQNYREAFIHLKPAAEHGQADAQYAIGYMYYYGQGVVENKEQAWYWINQAAHAGQVDAIAALKLLVPNQIVNNKP